MPSARKHQAIHIARRYLEARGYAVENVLRRPEEQGYDLIAKRNAENLKIAVKASTRPWNIPDLQASEVDAERNLVADFLYVVYFIGRKEPKLCIIPRDALKPEFLLPKFRYRVSPKLRKESTLRPFLRAI